jgi:23S rRNA-intervening sequence protein
MQSEESDLRQRTKEFGLQIVRMFSGLPKTAEAQVLGRQVLRSGTSVGANYREAYRARSRPEWSEWDKRHARQRREGSGSELGGERMNLSRNAAIHCANSRRPLTGLNCSSMDRSSPQKSCRLSVKNGATGMSDMHGNAARVAE